MARLYDTPAGIETGLTANPDESGMILLETVVSSDPPVEHSLNETDEPAFQLDMTSHAGPMGGYGGASLSRTERRT